MKSILTILTVGLLAGSIAQADTNIAEIHGVITQYESALNASSADSVMKLYSKNPTFMPQHAPAQVGRDAVKQAYDNVFNTIKLDIKFSIHEVEVLGDTAWARTSSAGKTQILANNAVVNEGNNELFIFKKENGDWKIHRYLFSTNQPRQ
ncbi:MAG: SgcJ/EcaC family oxidoreductase [Betaproteobacteria bacterium]|nr:SgcJ/EcaC family oxidoreductase [Betaproteobacteria bacterium]